MTEPNVARESGETAAGLGSRLWREILKTPAFRQIIMLNLTDLEPARARVAVRTLVWADPNFSLSLAAVAPQVVNYLAEALLELARQWQHLPPELADAFLRASLADLDRQTLTAAQHALAPHLLASLPSLLRAMTTLFRDLAEALNELPPERRTALLDRLLGGLDGARLAEAVNAWSLALLNLRRDRPDLADRLQPELVKLVDTVDSGRLREGVLAASSLSVDIGMKLIEPALRDPAVFANLAGIVPLLLNDAFRLGGYLLSQVQLPPEVVASSLFYLLGELDVAALADLLNAAARLINQLHEGGAILGGGEPYYRRVFTELAEGTLDRLDREAVAQALAALGEDAAISVKVLFDWLCRNLSADDRARLLAILKEGGARLGRAVVAAPAVRRAGEAPAVGRRLNDRLIAFNRRLEARPGAAAQYVRSVFREIDPRELEKAVRHALDLVLAALLTSGRYVTAVVRPLAAAGWKVFRYQLGALKRKLLKQGEYAGKP